MEGKNSQNYTRAVVFLNGERYQGEIDLENAYVIAVDGGYLHCKERGILPDVTLGDFDSLGFVPEGGVCFPTEKDATDGELALSEAERVAKRYGFTEVVFYDAGGGRDDHFLGTLELLLFAEKLHLVLTIYTNHSKIYLKNASFSSKTVKGRTVSLVPFCKDVHIIDSRGLYYPLKNLNLKRGETRGISNVTTEESFALDFTEGELLVVENL